VTVIALASSSQSQAAQVFFAMTLSSIGCRKSPAREVRHSARKGRYQDL
jgi:hypothetical protein